MKIGGHIWTSEPDGVRTRIASARYKGFAFAVLAAVGWLLLVLAIRANVIDVSFSSDWDESVYLLTAEAWLQGGLPYVTIWDQHPIGVPAIIAAGGWITGDVLLAARLEAAIATAVAAWILTRFSWPSRSRWLAGLVYVVLMSRLDGIAAQTEPFNAALVSSASLLLFLACRPATRFHLAKAAAGALLLGCALQVKYLVVPECVLLCSFHLLQRRAVGDSIASLTRRALLLLACGLAPTIAAGAYFAMAGQFQAFIQSNLYANAAYVEMTPTWSEFFHMAYLGARPLFVPSIALAILLAFAALRIATGRRSEVPRSEGTAFAWLLVWTVAAALDVCLPMKFWPHYFLMLYGPLCASLPLAVDALRRRLPRRVGLIAATALAAVAIVDAGRMARTDLVLLAKRTRDDVPRRIAHEILAHGPGVVYVVDYLPIVYLLAHSTPPTRFVLPSELGADTSSSGANATQELRSILAKHPRYIVTSDPPMDPLTPGMREIIAGMLGGYVPALSLRDATDSNREVTLYVQRSPGDAPPDATPG